METCPRCGKESPDNSLHCVHCGAKLASAAARTQFGMPVLSLPGAATGGDSAKGGSAKDGSAKGGSTKDAKIEASKADHGEAREIFGGKLSGALAPTEKKSNPLAGLGSLKGGRRPGSLLKGLPQFRGAGQSPLTSGEFALGKPGGLSGLGLYSAAKRSSLPPEAAPEQSDQPEPVAPEDPGPTMAMPGVSAADLAQSAGADAGSPNAAGVDADKAGAASVDADKAADDPGPTLAMPGVSAADLASGLGAAGSGEVEKPATPSAPVVARPAPVQVSKPVRRTDEPSADSSVAHSSVADSPGTNSSARMAAGSKPLSEAPLPVAMRGSERAHHPHERGVTQARTTPEGGGNGKWIVIGVLVLAIGVAVWLMQG